MFKNKLHLLLLTISILFITGCISLKTKEGNINDSGVYKTNSRGDKWSQMTLIPTVSGRPKSIGGINVNVLVMDPSDNKAIYWGSEGNGLFYTYDGAKNWQMASGLGQKTINAVAVDPNSKCVIYAAAANEVHKSTDCSRTWSRVYFDNSEGARIGAVAVDQYDSSNIYIGTSRGEIIKSQDGGGTWRVIERIKNEIRSIIISPNDSRNIFTATKGNGIFRSLDNGDTWENLKKNLKEFKGNTNFKNLVVLKGDPGLIFLATNYGVLKSSDNGDSWSKIELISPAKGAKINTIAVNPQNAKEIYYVTNTTFFRSLDGGENWTTKKLPTSGDGRKLLIDPKDPSIIYMGVRKVEKK